MTQEDYRGTSKQEGWENTSSCFFYFLKGFTLTIAISQWKKLIVTR
jgi:hypothetical protein